MKKVLVLSAIIMSFALTAAASADIANAPAPEIFRIKIHPKLAKLTQDLKHPGGYVNIEYAPEGKETVAEIVLDKNCAVYNGDEHCHGWWSQVLSFDGFRYSYFVYLGNSAHTDDYTVVLTICLTGEVKAENCGKWISSQLNFRGKNVPMLKTYDSSHWNNQPHAPASYQPVLEIGPTN